METLQIKVKETKMQEVFAHKSNGEQAGSNKSKVYVADGRLQLITPDQDVINTLTSYGRLATAFKEHSIETGKNHLGVDLWWKRTGAKLLGVPYLVSDNEICKTGELYISSIRKRILVKEAGVIQAGSKIIAFPHQFSPKQLHAMVEQKLIDNDRVSVECVQYATVNEKSDWIYKGKRLKVDSVYIDEDRYGNHGGGQALRLSLIGSEFEEKHGKSTVIWTKDLVLDAEIKLNASGHITIHKPEEDKKLFSETQLKEAMLFASSHLSSTRGIEEYIRSIKNNELVEKYSGFLKNAYKVHNEKI